MQKKNATGSTSSGEEQITKLLAKFSPEKQKLIRSVRKALQKRFPTANELAYDYGKSFVLSYSPTEVGADAVAAIAADDKQIRFVLNFAIGIPDPYKLLTGNATQTRYIVLQTGKEILSPEVDALINAVVAKLKTPLAKSGKGRLIIKSSKKKAASKVVKPKPAATKSAAKKTVTERARKK